MPAGVTGRAYSIGFLGERKVEKMLNRKGLTELAKSFGRFVWFGLLGLVSTFLINLAANPDLAKETVTFNGMTFNVGALLVIGIGLAIKAIDRYRHSSTANDSKGLAPGFLQR